MMHSVIVLSKPMLDNGDEFLSPDMSQQNSNDSLRYDHLTRGKLIPYVTRCIKKFQYNFKLNQSNFKTLS